MKEEQWKIAIVNGEEWKEYEVSTWGNVRSNQYSRRHKGTGHLLKVHYGSGYGQVTLKVRDRKKTCYVHRLVAETWIPNPNNYSDVNHIDEDKHNNSVENLEWLPHKKNMEHGTQAKRGAETKKKRYFETNQVFIKVKHIDTGIVYSSIRQAEKETGYTGADICDCCKRGEHWEFIDWEYVE